MLRSLIQHYRRLWFFNFRRFDGDNYRRMREYFASVLIDEVESFMPLAGKQVLDVGGAQGEFCRVLSDERGCHAVNLDPAPHGSSWPDTLVGCADEMPFAAGRFDLVICRGVLEHVPTLRQQRSVDEMYRVTKPGGLCYVMIPPWFNPHAGHQLKPFHVLPFRAAKRFRQWVFRTPIEAASLEELGLYPITVRRMLRLIRASGFRCLAVRDTHLRLHLLARLPVLRELLVPAVSFVLTK